MMMMMIKYPHIVVEVVVAAGVLPKGKQSFTMSAVGGTFLGQEENGVPKLIGDLSMKIDHARE